MPEAEKPLSLEKKLETLRTLVNQMQQGVGDFDQQVAAFKKGQELIEQCREDLDAADMQVKQLLNGEWQDLPAMEE